MASTPRIYYGLDTLFKRIKDWAESTFALKDESGPSEVDPDLVVTKLNGVSGQRKAVTVVKVTETDGAGSSSTKTYGGVDSLTGVSNGEATVTLGTYVTAHQSLAGLCKTLKVLPAGLSANTESNWVVKSCSSDGIIKLTADDIGVDASGAADGAVNTHNLSMEAHPNGFAHKLYVTGANAAASEANIAIYNNRSYSQSGVLGFLLNLSSAGVFSIKLKAQASDAAASGNDTFRVDQNGVAYVRKPDDTAKTLDQIATVSWVTGKLSGVSAHNHPYMQTITLKSGNTATTTLLNVSTTATDNGTTAQRTFTANIHGDNLAYSEDSTTTIKAAIDGKADSHTHPYVTSINIASGGLTSTQTGATFTATDSNHAFTANLNGTNLAYNSSETTTIKSAIDGKADITHRHMYDAGTLVTNGAVTISYNSSTMANYDTVVYTMPFTSATTAKISFSGWSKSSVGPRKVIVAVSGNSTGGLVTFNSTTLVDATDTADATVYYLTFVNYSGDMKCAGVAASLA